jgi:purine-binding chemotaxis protein CheW
MSDAEKSGINSYLTFKIGDETFAAHVSKILNIIEMTRITKIPMVPHYMKGVINLRGTVIPLIDLKLKFGMPETEYNLNTCILVLEFATENKISYIGAIVDSVSEVIEITDTELQPAPGIGSKYKAGFIDAIYKTNHDEFILILNIDLILSSDEIENIRESASIADTKDS